MSDSSLTTVIAPSPDPDDAFFWEGASNGQLRIQRCPSCDRLCHPPSPMCPECGSIERSSVEVSGRGTVYSWIESKHPTEPDAAPRVVAIVELDEGVRLVSNLVDIALDDVHHGLAVEVTFSDLGGFTAPQFRPAGAITNG